MKLDSLLTQVPSSEYKKNGRTWATFSCKCGSLKDLSKTKVVNRHILSCGCLVNTNATKHGLRKHPLYSKWNSMISRCYVSSSISYQYYGERGIEVCDMWRDSFIDFYNWAIENGYREDLELDRIDVNKGYSPENCRFVDHSTQMSNRRIYGVSKYKGVILVGNRWRAYHYTEGKTIHLGLFKSEDEAFQHRENFLNINLNKGVTNHAVF